MSAQLTVIARLDAQTTAHVNVDSCDECGALILSRTKHAAWHRRMAARINKAKERMP